MSDEKAKDVERKTLSKEILEKQVAESQQFIQRAQQQVQLLTQQIEQNMGVLGFAQHLLKQFEVPSVPEEKKPLEVK